MGISDGCHIQSEVCKINDLIKPTKIKGPRHRDIPAPRALSHYRHIFFHQFSVDGTVGSVPESEEDPVVGTVGASVVGASVVGAAVVDSGAVVEGVRLTLE